MFPLKNKTRSGLKRSELLLSVNLIDFDWKSIQKEVNLLKELPVSKRSENLLITGPLLRILIRGGDSGTLIPKILVEISYKIEIFELIFEQYSIDLVNSIRGVVLDSSKRMTTEYEKKLENPNISRTEPISPQLFYRTVSDHTRSLNSVELRYDIPELETQLLRFQRKTVKWLLDREGVQYDSTNNRCEPKKLLSNSIQRQLKEFEEKFNHLMAVSDLDNEVHALLLRMCFGWSMIELNHKVYWYNPYTGCISTRKLVYDTILKTFEESSNVNFPAQGLLAEEMGLGKTVEITTLVILNQRPIEEINEPINISLKPYGDIKTIPKAKTTLIISPDSILKQWVEEIVRLAPSLAVTVYNGVDKYQKLNNNASLIAEYLRGFDIVFTTYSTISKELDYALYSTRKKPTRTSATRKRTIEQVNDTTEESESSTPDGSGTKYDKSELLNQYRSLFQLTLELKKPKIANERATEDQVETDYEKALQDEIMLALKHNRIPNIYHDQEYQSPLMLTHFWRVVLDEVQMVSSRLSRAFQSAALIPRHHAWGVSGTPIKKDFGDLNSVLRFLSVEPFGNEYYAKNSWEKLISSTDNSDFVKLWSMISLRHTKAMVHDDIKLPPQSRVLMTIPFNPVEQENYNQMFEECLAAICLDEKGNPVLNDWEPTNMVLAHMRYWLVKLRQVCCNPQIGNLNFKRYKSRNHHLFYGKLVNTVQQLKTLENVLDDMLGRAYDQITEAEKEKVQLYLDLAEFQEYILSPADALEFLKVGVRDCERIIARLNIQLKQYIKKYKSYKKIDSSIASDKDESELDQFEDDDISTNENTYKTSDFIQTTPIRNESTEEAIKYEDKIKATRLKLRSWNVLLHKYYFLIASCHFQCYDELYLQKIKDSQFGNIPYSEGIGKLKVKDTSKDEISAIVCGIHINDSVTIDPITNFSPGEELKSEEDISAAKNRFLEHEYYGLAERVRERILQGSIKAVMQSVKLRITSRGLYQESEFYDRGEIQFPKNSKKLFKYLPLIDIEYLEASVVGMKSKLFYNKIQNISKQLNKQARTINMWMDELLRILCKPLLSHDKTPDGAEYEESIEDQEKALCYLHVLTKTINDRSDAILGGEKTNKTINTKKQQKEMMDRELNNVNNTEFLNSLQEKLNEEKITLSISLQEIALSTQATENDLEDNVNIDAEHLNGLGFEKDLFAQLSLKVRKIFDNQKLAQVLLHKEITVNYNAVFNTRIEYFKQLQQISDSVGSQYTLQSTLQEEEIGFILTRFVSKHSEIVQRMTKSVAKYRYLQSLVQPVDSDTGGIEEDEDSHMCTICRSSITIGSLTQCGHKYCKDCLEHWLRNSRSCPMCKTQISEMTIYNFTHHKPNLKANTVNEGELVKAKLATLHSIYKSINASVIEDIQLIELKTSYSSKVDMIIKQVLYLKNQNPDVQIVIFSQWQDLLYIIGTALKTVNISYLASHGTLTPEIGGGRRRNKYDSVEQFKNPTLGITCFLLNAKAQASGLTLINATHIFLCEPLVNTSLELQAISRIHRIGQTKPTTVWMFAIENTVEESILLMSTNKRLQYFETPQSEKDVSNRISNTNEKDLSNAESITMMKSGGIDTLVNKSHSEGESVTNGDLWNAFFSATSTTDTPVKEFHNMK